MGKKNETCKLFINELPVATFLCQSSILRCVCKKALVAGLWGTIFTLAKVTRVFIDSSIQMQKHPNSTMQPGFTENLDLLQRSISITLVRCLHAPEVTWAYSQILRMLLFSLAHTTCSPTSICSVHQTAITMLQGKEDSSKHALIYVCLSRFTG